jgi:hypothetical protein
MMSHAPCGSVGLLANAAMFPHYCPQSLGVVMSAIQFRRFPFVLLAATLACLVLPVAGYAYTAEQQQACQGDAFRLCGPEIPDVDRVTACMIQKQAELSPGCRVFFRHDPEPKVGVKAKAKGNVKAASSKSRKSKKAKPAAT